MYKISDFTSDLSMKNQVIGTINNTFSLTEKDKGTGIV